MGNEQLSAIAFYRQYADQKYQALEKCEADERLTMQALKQAGQAARKAFQQLVAAVQAQLPTMTWQRVSGWLNQAQMARPYFFAYFHEAGCDKSAIGFALRVVADRPELTVSVEVSFIERHRVAESLVRQNRVLELPVQAPIYYVASTAQQTERLAGTEANRQLLREQVANQQVRKVLVKIDVPCENQTLEAIAEQLVQAVVKLSPYHNQTQQGA